MKLHLSYICLVLIIIFPSCKSSKKVTSIDFHDGSYVGEVDGKGLKQGKGSYKWLDGSFYEGDFEKDLRHGIGHFRWANGESYKGDYLQDQRTGQGIYAWPDGSYYEGSFLNGKRHGDGVFSASNGAKHEGGWFDDKRHGQGSFTAQNGGTISGIWQNGKLLAKPIDLPQPTTKPDISFDNFSTEEESVPSGSDNIINIEIDAHDVKSSEKLSDPGKISSSISTQNESINPPTKENSEKEEPVQEVLISTDPVKDEDVIILPKPQPEEPPAVTSKEEVYIWTGTVEEVEIKFITKLIDGIDTIFDRNTNTAYSGKMRILDNSGKINGELDLQNGRMDGDELYFENGKLIEKNLWQNGKFIRSLPIN
jgi:hypothetical protein